MGIVDWLNQNLRAAIKDTFGCMVITHSRFGNKARVVGDRYAKLLVWSMLTSGCVRIPSPMSYPHELPLFDRPGHFVDN